MVNFVPGYVKSPDDPRDYRLVSLHRPEEIPSHYIAKQIGDILVFDQGSRGTCVANAAAGMKEWQELLDRRVVAVLSREYLYQRCKQQDGIPTEEGTYPRVAMDILTSFGICREELCPYQPVMLPLELNAAMDEGGAANRIVRYARVQKLHDLKSAIMHYGPIVIAISVYANFFDEKVGYTGFVLEPAGDYEGGHALMAYGWTPGRVLFRNSWGTGWGQNGNGSLPNDYPGLFDDAWLTVDVIEGPMQLEIPAQEC